MVLIDSSAYCPLRSISRSRLGMREWVIDAKSYQTMKLPATTGSATGPGLYVTLGPSVSPLPPGLHKPT